MTLKDYVEREYGGVTALAVALGVSISVVSMWASGARLVPVSRCLDIERITEGKVKVESLRPDINWKRFRKPKRPS